MKNMLIKLGSCSPKVRDEQKKMNKTTTQLCINNNFAGGGHFSFQMVGFQGRDSLLQVGGDEKLGESRGGGVKQRPSRQFT